MTQLTPTHLVAHLYFLQSHKAKLKNPKEPPSQRTDIKTMQQK
jgi:hypothetical protein